MNFMPFGQLKSFLKILIEVQYNSSKTHDNAKKFKKQREADRLPAVSIVTYPDFSAARRCSASPPDGT